jgi:hypothetical protein
MIVIVIVFLLAIKNIVIIQMKHCTHCERNYHVKSECRDKYFHLKRDQDQSNRENQSNRNDRNKRKRKNDNDNNNDNNIRNDDDDKNVERFYKFYIVMFFETLSTMSVIFAQTIFWALNNACFQHNIRKKSTFISYTIFNKFISINNLAKSVYVMKQKIVRVICRVDNKWMNISFFDVFYVSKCLLNLISFDQLNEIRCLMSYKSSLFTIKNQDIITKKRVNNVFFFELWKHVSYNFIITFIVGNLIEQLIDSKSSFAINSKSNSAINKKILNIWHARLKHLRKQNVRRLAKMSEEMNLIKSIKNKNFCVSCIVTKQKTESHNNFVILDKHSLNLVWSDLVQSFVFNDDVKFFVTFLCDCIKRSMIYVLRVKFDTFDAFKHFRQHNEHENNVRDIGGKTHSSIAFKVLSKVGDSLYIYSSPK